MNAEFDPRRDECEAYAARLRDAGVQAVSRTMPGHIHGSMTLPDWQPARDWRAEANSVLASVNKAALAGQTALDPVITRPTVLNIPVGQNLPDTESTVRASAARTVLVADSTKFARSATAVVCATQEVDVLVTDSSVPAGAASALRGAGVDILPV